MSKGPSRPTRYHRFEFKARCYDPSSGEIRLGYQLDDLELCERFYLPIQNVSLKPAVTEAVSRAVDLLHLIAGISYWKMYCPPSISLGTHALDQWQAHALREIYLKGLGEFAWHHELSLGDRLRFEANLPTENATPHANEVGSGEALLLPLGGGKDSVVAWQRLFSRIGHEQIMGVQVGTSPLIRSLGEWMVSEGYLQTHWVIERVLDPSLTQLNKQGAMNGHVPITAINAAVLTVFALVIGARGVCFSNERSADEPTLISNSGQPVNHQYSKSFEFEELLDDWIKKYICSDLEVFSILRRDRELAITQDYAKLTQFHPHCSSCNRNFHIDPSGRIKTRWCLNCPKCYFVFLALAVFMSPRQLSDIFGEDLLASGRHTNGFKQLLGLDGQKPFECVGEVAEARAAVLALANSQDWSRHAVVAELLPMLSGIKVPSLEELLTPQGPHRIPSDLL